jgi:hypothetical protein
VNVKASTIMYLNYKNLVLCRKYGAKTLDTFRITETCTCKRPRIPIGVIHIGPLRSRDALINFDFNPNNS